jgi:hypothetical protein
MTVKNYIVNSVRPIRNGWMLEKNRDLYLAYQKMSQYSRASYEHYVEEPFEYIQLTDEVDDNDTYTIAVWEDIKRIWNREPCNIFFAGADTIMIRPTSLFSDRFQEYRMFNYTDPKSEGDFSHYFNDDIQYYPHTMAQAVWDLGEKLWSQRVGHPYQHWGFDQIRHNYMFWSQDIPLEDRIHPKLAYQAMNLRALTEQSIAWHNTWNGIDINDAHILHFHASRGSQQVIDLMQYFCNYLEIPYDNSNT